MKKAAVWTVVVVTGLGVYGAASGQSEIEGGSGSGAAPASSSVEQTPDTNLSIIEQGHRDDSSRTYRRIATLLDLTQADCPDDSREQLADMTAGTMIFLDKAGVEAAPIEILEDVRESSSLRMHRSCADLFALYATVRRDIG